MNLDHKLYTESASKQLAFTVVNEVEDMERWSHLCWFVGVSFFLVAVVSDSLLPDSSLFVFFFSSLLICCLLIHFGF